MESSTQSLEKTDQLELEKNDWNPEAWVYFIWVVMDRSVYCKIGYSANPTIRFNQVLAGIPERPFRINLLPCLNVGQAKLFDAMFLDYYKTRERRVVHSPQCQALKQGDRGTNRKSFISLPDVQA